MIPLKLPRWQYHFRAWNKKDKRMYVWDEMCENNDLEFFFTNPDVIPLMWTGVTDQDGKYIYEGDIVRISHKAFDFESEDEEVFADGGEVYSRSYPVTRDMEAKTWDIVASYEQNWCRFTVAADTCDLEKRYDPKAEFKGVVIGNIYQNPELYDPSNPLSS